MTRRPQLRSQAGFTLIEVMLVSLLSIVVFGITLAVWTTMTRTNSTLERQQDNAEEARVALDRAARQLRNLANPTVNAITTIDRATDYDFIFQTSDPSKTWVRYCLQTSGGGTSPEKATLWESESTTAITAGMRGACPGTGWSRSTRVVANVVNQAPGGVDRDIFTYECGKGAPAGCPTSTAEYPKIENVGLSLWVDRDRADQASELNVATSVFLRNQNEAPTAAIGPVVRLDIERVLLNASGSSDPEGRTLEYYWFEGAPPSAATIASTSCTAPYPGNVWQGVTLNKKFAAGTAGQSKTFYLLVRDPGCLTSMTSITFSVPS